MAPSPTPTTIFLPLAARNFSTISEAIVTPEEGGVAVSPNDRLRLNFPPGAALAPRAVDRALFIELAAQELDGGATVTHFSHPVQATARYDPATLSDGGESRLTLRVRSGPGQAWRSLPSQIDAEAQTVSAPLLHFSELGLFTTSLFSDVTPIRLAPFIPLAPSTGSGVFYAHTAVVTYTEGEVWLSSTPDGQGELFTDDVVVITVIHEGGDYAIYTHDYYDPFGSVYTTTAPVELSALFAPGVNTVAIALNRLDILSGNFMWRERDLSVFGLGPAVVFQRTYNSFDDSSGIFGAGWSSPFDSRLWRHFDGSVEVRRADGQRALFVPQGGGFAPEPGVFDRLERDGAGFVLTEKRSLTEYHYDGDGKLQSIADRHGNAVDIEYLGAEIRVTDAAQREYTLHLGDGRVVRITDPANRTVRYTYGAGESLLTFIGLRGAPMEYGYDPLGRLTAVTNTLGVRVAGVTYDEYGRVWEYEGALSSGNTILRTQAHEATLIDAEGYSTVMYYDDRWRVEKLIDTFGNPVRYTYDDRDLRLSISDQLNHTTRFGYDEAGNITTLANPLSYTLTYTYNSLDLPVQRVNADGAVIDYAYEEADLTGVYQSGLLTLTIDYDDAGQIKKLENGGGNGLELGYDDHGDITVVSSTLGYTTTYEYDGVGRIVNRTDTQSNTIGFGYDVGGAVTTITDSKNLTITYTYDSEGRVCTRTEYDALGRPIHETDPLSGTTGYEYDAVGGVTRYEYDGLNRRTAMVNAENQRTEYEYDGAGNLTVERVCLDAACVTAHTKRYAYDAANRLIVVTNTLGHPTRYAYDAAGNRTVITNARGFTTTYGYDPLNRQAVVTDPLSHTTHTAYDALGRAVAITDAEENRARYAYGALGRLITVTDALSGTTVYEYDALGNRVAQTDANGNTTTFVYDPLDRQVLERDPLGNEWAYAYDANGNLVRREDANGVVTRYTYDALDRRARIHYPADPAQDVVFGYDPNGNLTQMTDPLGALLAEYDPLNRLTSVTDYALRTTQYAYDPVGNLTRLTYPNDAAVSYTYNPNDWLETMTDPNANVTRYGYNPDGLVTQILYGNTTWADYATTKRTG